MAGANNRMLPTANSDQWKAALKDHAESRKQDRIERWNKALKYYHEITNIALDASESSRPISLQDLLKSVEDQSKRYDGFREKPEARLPTLKKRHAFLPWRSKKSDVSQSAGSMDSSLTKSVDDAPTQSRASTQAAPERTAKRLLMDKVKLTFGPIELIGRMTVDTFGQTYPGVAYAFGSVSFLIKSAQGVSSLYDSIEEFFDTLKPFLDRLAVYSQRELSPELEDLVTDVLIAIIRINGIATSIISRNNRALQYLRVVLGKDEGIAKELAALKKLLEDESRMVSALLFRDGLARPSAGLEPVKKPEHDVEARLAEIKASLGPVVAKGAPENILRSNKMRRAADTGTWIISEPAFKAWAAHEMPVLWVSGGPGAGKTFLSCFVVQHLLDMISLEAFGDHNVSVAYFFCKDDVPELRKFDNALRTMSYQICKNNPAYAHYISSSCSEAGELDTETIWYKLFSEYFKGPPRYSDYGPVSPGTVYLVLDGLDETDTKDRRSFLKTLGRWIKHEHHGTRLQLLFLGRPELTPELESSLGKNMQSIPVTAQKNSEDIERFIKESIDDGRLSEARIPERHQQAFVERFSKRADGMFLWADLMIDELSLKDDFHEVQIALNKAPYELKDRILHTLKSFGETLDKDKVFELNEMLAWVACAQRRLTLAELKEIVTAKRESAPVPQYFELDYIDEMAQFESSVRKRYASLFTLTREDGLSTEDLKDELEKREKAFLASRKTTNTKGIEDPPNTGDNRQSSNPRMMSSPATEIAIAHSAIKEFFQHHEKTTVVGVDLDIAHASIALDLLGIICSTQPSTSMLYAYACNSWQCHLSLSKLDKVNADLKKQIGALIAKVFRDRGVCLPWISRVVGFWRLWVLNQENQNYVRNWLCNPEFSANLTADDRSWVDQLEKEPGNDILHLPYEICAHEWLKSHEWMPFPCFQMVAAYMETLSCLKAGKGWPLAPFEFEKPTGKYVHKVARWTGLQEDATWHCRLGFTFRHFRLLDSAVEEHMIAIEKGQVLPSLAGLAFCHEDLGDLHKAVEWMGKALAALKEETNHGIVPERAVQAYLRSMGEWQAKIDNQEEAKAAWEQLQKQSLTDSFAATNLLNLHYASGDFDALVSLLEELNQELPGPEHHVTLLSRICVQWYSRDEEQLPYCPGIEEAAFQKGKINIIQNMYRSAIGSAETMDDLMLTSLLKTDLAQVLYRYYEDDEAAIKLWKQVKDVRHGKSSHGLLATRRIASNRLQEVYVHRAAIAKDSAHLKHVIEDFEELIDATDPSSEDSIHRNTDPSDPTDFAKLRMGLLYVMANRDEDALGQVRGMMQRGLSLLEDRSFEEAFVCLKSVFISLGDYENALAAISRLSSDTATKPNGLPQDTPALNHGGGGQAEKKASRDADSSPPLTFSRVCDGCSLEAPKPNGFWRCCYCTDIDWCTACHAKFDKGELKMFPPRKCDRRHKFLEIPDWEGELGWDKIRVADEQWDLRRWIESIKARYPLPAKMV